MTKVKLISITPDCEKIVAYCARVSNPANQENENIEGLLRYCIRKKHWSVFEQGDMTVEITTSRAIAAQLLRHNSAKFQEFSQRYAEAVSTIIYSARRQDTKNKQNSIDDFDQETKDWFVDAQEKVRDLAFLLYKEALNKGIAKEQARFLLPLSTSTTLYMKNNIRNWIHYLAVRNKEEGAQLEHVEIADQIRNIIKSELPIISKAVWG